MFLQNLILTRTVLNDCVFFLWTVQTKAAKAVLGKYYREPKKSGPIPFHLFDNLVKSMNQDHYVSDIGDIVYYQTDPQLIGSEKNKDY